MVALPFQSFPIPTELLESYQQKKQIAVPCRKKSSGSDLSADFLVNVDPGCTVSKEKRAP
jgi:hypothetical protein